MFTDLQKIGMGLVGASIVFIFLGILLLFDKGLLAIGNILFVVGLTCLIGLERTYRFFFQTHKLRGTGCFLGGILIVLFGWPIIGIIIEIYGAVYLFGAFLPVAVSFVRRVPVIGNILCLPGINKVIVYLLENREALGGLQ